MSKTNVKIKREVLFCVIRSITLACLAVLLTCGTTFGLTPKYGGVLSIATSRNPDTWDPQASRTGEAFLSVIYEGLVRVNEDQDIEPLLAEAWEITSKDVIFHLRKGVKFHNGKPLTASDVVYCMERVRSSDPPTEDSSVFQTTKAIEAIDDYTVRVEFETFYAPFLESVGRIMIFPPEMVDELETTPIGTGPFILSEFIPDERALMLKNDNYWQQGLPYLDGVEFRILPDPTTAVIAFEQKEADVLAAEVPVPTDVLKRMLENPKIKFYHSVAPNYTYLCYNNLFPPTDHQIVRNAIAHAINREVLSQVVYEGIFETAKTFFPPTSWAHNEDIPLPEYNPAEAKRLFQEAGIQSLVAKVPTKEYNPHYYQTVEIIGEELAKVGVQLQIIPMEIGRWLEAIVPEPQESFAFWVYGSSELPDPDYLYAPQMLNVPSYCGYRNPEVQEGLRMEALQYIERAERMKAYDEMQKILVEDLPILPLVWVYQYVKAHDYVVGFDAPYYVGWYYIEKTYLNR